MLKVLFKKRTKTIILVFCSAINITLRNWHGKWQMFTWWFVSIYQLWNSIADCRVKHACFSRKIWLNKKRSGSVRPARPALSDLPAIRPLLSQPATCTGLTPVGHQSAVSGRHVGHQSAVSGLHLGHQSAVSNRHIGHQSDVSGLDRNLGLGSSMNAVFYNANRNIVNMPASIYYIRPSINEHVSNWWLRLTKLQALD